MSSLTIHADVKVAGLFTDHMVLQRDMQVPVWGWADKGEEVSVAFAGQTVKSTAAEDGRWQVNLAAMPANKNGQVMLISGENQLKVNDIVIGDVWICSGQSNMAYVLRKTLNYDEEIKNADYPLIRQINMNSEYHLWPKVKSAKRPWIKCTPKDCLNFRAVAYFFARKVFKETGVPVGLISSNWGGTPIEAWIPFEGYKIVPEMKDMYDRIKTYYPNTEEGKAAFEKYLKSMEEWIANSRAQTDKGKIPVFPPTPAGYSFGRSVHSRPTFLYNGMINPIIPYAIKGVLWYQGEANGGQGEKYYHRMKALIQGWREVWGQGDFPFYFVQLPNYRTSKRNNAAGGDGWAKIRESQLKSLSIPNTGMAVTIDVGEARDIHPKNKQDVGKRLAALALANLYGKDVLASGPLYKEHKVEGNKIRISFDYSKGGLMAGTKDRLKPVVEVKDSEITWFAVAGKNKKWHWAKAEIDGETVLVSSEKVAAPAAVRYAYTYNPEGAKLYNKAGIPASPFRTDEW
jgi:sialate O-acetylesterase